MVAQTPQSSFTPQTMVPDLLTRHPEVRPVLDRYGLRGCGGARGPHESLSFFARMHGVAESTLIEELQRAIGQGVAAVSEALLGIADTIYRRYFVAAIVATLTLGAGWGVWLLWQIGLAGTFTGVSIHDVNAHGHAQIAAWVGLFIMGFAYQSLPRFWHTSLAAPRLAVATFIAMLLGVAAATAGMWAHDQPWSLPAAMIGGAIELAAIAVFAGQIVATRRRAAVPFEPYLLFVFTALAFFIVQAAFGLWHTWTTMTAGSQEELVWYVATYQAVLRDLQIHGLALFMILGVSLRVLPGLLNVPAASPRRVYLAWGMLVAAVVGEAVLFIAYRWTGNHRIAATLMAPWVLLAIGSLMLPWIWKLWRRSDADHAERAGKFIRVAYGWLALSMAMLLLLPVYQVISGIPFSHAYYGAIRHAITVGFISLMIMGVAAKVVPTLAGVNPRTLSALWGPFVLVNVGCALRVSLQTLTDWHDGFFAMVGISGVLELAGLTWWGLHLVGLMLRRTDADNPQPALLSIRPPAIRADHYVADVLNWFPETQAVFDRFGFAPLRNPILRRTVARYTTVAQAAAHGNIALPELLDALNAERESAPASDPIHS